MYGPPMPTVDGLMESLDQDIPEELEDALRAPLSEIPMDGDDERDD